MAWKKIIPSPAKTQTEPFQSSLLKMGTKRHNDSNNHGSDEAKHIKFEESKLQNGLSIVEVDAQPRQSQ